MARFRNEHGIKEAANAPKSIAPWETTQPLTCPIQKERNATGATHHKTNALELVQWLQRSQGCQACIRSIF